VFFIQLLLGEEMRREMIQGFGVVPIRTWAGLIGGSDLTVGIGTLFTSMFLHGSIFHLFGNMWFLWIFGDNVEDRLGWARFLGSYLLAGLCADAAQILANLDSHIPMIGASGAISGVMGIYLMLYPKVRIQTYWGYGISGHMSARRFMGIWILFQLVMGLLSWGGTGGGIAWWAHVGGFVAGLLLGFILTIAPRHHNNGSGGQSRARA
jgi:membrane associated rhomboid family serine protease